MARIRSFAYLLLLLFVVTIPWEGVVALPAVGSITRLVGLVAVGVAAIGLIRNGRIVMRAPSLLLIVATLFILWNTATIFWTIDPALSIRVTITSVQLLAMVWLIWEFAGDPKRRDGVAQAFVVGSFIAVINIVVAVWLFPESIRVSGRISTGSANANDIATMMALSIPFAWMLTLRYRSGLRYWFNLVHIPLALTAIVLTGSRGGVVVAVIGLLAIPLTLVNARPVLRVILTMLPLTLPALAGLVPEQLALATAPNLERLATITDELSGSGGLTGRTQIWAEGLSVLLERPVLGYGVGTFRVAVEPGLGRQAAAHNAFLAIQVGGGIVANLLFVALLLTAGIPALLTRSSTNVVAVLIFLALLAGMMPLAWGMEKVSWFVLAWLAVLNPVVVSRIGPDRRASVVAPREAL